MMAQGNQKVLVLDECNDEIQRLNATIPEFSYSGKAQMYFRTNSEDGSATFEFLDDNIEKQQVWKTLPAVQYKEYRQQVYPDVGEKYETGTDDVSYFPLVFMNYDVSGFEDCSVRISQTLFNDDEKFEYLMPVLSDGLADIETFQDWDYEKEEYFVSVYACYGGAVVGFQVVSEDGTVLQTVNFDNNFVANRYDATVFQINGKLFLSFEGYVLNESKMTRQEAMLFYELDRQSSSIRKVAEHIGEVNVYPHIADHSENITVELSEGSTDGFREIIVTNAAGQTELRVPVKDGQKRVSFPAGKLSRGMNVVNTVGTKKRHPNKVMVK